jgi:hypothetical protein
MDGTQSPTKSPRSRSPENHSQIDKRKEMPAAAKKRTLDAPNTARALRGLTVEVLRVDA